VNHYNNPRGHRQIELVTASVIAKHGNRAQVNGYVELTERWNR